MMRRVLSVTSAALVLSALLACKKSKPTSDTGATSPATPGAATGAEPVPAEPAASPDRYVSDLDLARVCNELPMKEAKAYDGATDRIHPTIVFSRKNENDKFAKSYDSDFDGWKTDAAKDYELVACVTAKSSTKVKECKFDSKTPVHYLDLEDASYDMVVFEAQTGKQVAKKSVDLKVDKDCPMIWMFKNERDVKQAEFTQALMGWAKQWVAPKPGGAGAEDKPAAAAAAPAKAPDSKAPVAKSDPKAPAKAPAATPSSKSAPPASKTPPAATTSKPAPSKPPAK